MKSPLPISASSLSGLRQVCWSGYGARCVYTACKHLDKGCKADSSDWVGRSALIYGSLGFLGGVSVLTTTYAKFQSWSPGWLTSLHRLEDRLGFGQYATYFPASVLCCWRQDSQTEVSTKRETRAEAWMAGWLAVYYGLLVAGVERGKVLGLVAIAVPPYFPGVWVWNRLST